jgi:hypothetical protein
LSVTQNSAENYAFDYPVGYEFHHPVEAINYQINRWLPTAERSEFLAATAGSTLPEWEDRLLRLGDKAKSEGRALNAATYYRGAEFFMGSTIQRSSGPMTAIESKSRWWMSVSHMSASRFPT